MIRRFFDIEKSSKMCHRCKMGQKPTEMKDARIGEAVQLFLLENPLVAPELARSIVEFNWRRGVRDVDELTAIEQYANTYSDSDGEW